MSISESLRVMRIDLHRRGVKLGLEHTLIREANEQHGLTNYMMAYIEAHGLNRQGSGRYIAKL
jgi:hypothetical protein